MEYYYFYREFYELWCRCLRTDPEQSTGNERVNTSELHSLFHLAGIYPSQSQILVRNIIVFLFIVKNVSFKFDFVFLNRKWSIALGNGQNRRRRWWGPLRSRSANRSRRRRRSTINKRLLPRATTTSRAATIIIFWPSASFASSPTSWGNATNESEIPLNINFLCYRFLFAFFLI